MTRSAAKLSNGAMATAPQSGDPLAQTAGVVAIDSLICGSHLGSLLKGIHSQTKTVFACKAGESYKFQNIKKRHFGSDSQATTCDENSFDYSG